MPDGQQELAEKKAKLKAVEVKSSYAADGELAEDFGGLQDKPVESVYADENDADFALTSLKPNEDVYESSYDITEEDFLSIMSAQSQMYIDLLPTDDMNEIINDII